MRNVPAQTPRVNNSRVAQPSAATQQDMQSWLTAALEDPDPGMRLHTLETSAQIPGETLDPVTYALVDPDESVRTRAQALFEDALARR